MFWFFISSCSKDDKKIVKSQHPNVAEDYNEMLEANSDFVLIDLRNQMLTIKMMSILNEQKFKNPIEYL